jgi:photosystem II stability/assembly factor-like uncharacterized protein
MIRRRAQAVAVIGAVAMGVGATAAFGVMSDVLTASHTITTGTLQPATALAGTHPNTTGTSAGQVNLTWSASASPFVTGHRVLSASAAAGPFSTLATLGAAATSHNDATAPYNGERYYRIQSYRNLWTSDTVTLSTHSRPMASGADRVGGTGAGTALTGPWTTGGTQLAAVSVADATRYQPTAWPAAPTTMLGVFYLDATHAWSSGTGTISAYDGANWVSQNPGVAGNLEQVFFANTTTGWAVGAGGTIVATTSGGTTWTVQTSGTGQALRDIECVSTTTCWAVGAAGTIRVTTNGGTTWTGQTSGTGSTLWEIDCVSASTCWAVASGGGIIKTINGGTTWTVQTSGTTNRLRSISCLDANTCWAAGDAGTIRATTNGGTNWNAVTSGTTQIVRSVLVVSASVVYVAGDATTVRKTTNGGTSWTAQTPPTAAYQSISCISANDCLIVSDLGTVLKTTDGGASWGEQASRYVELTPLTVNLATGGAVSNVSAKFVYRTTTIPGAGTRFILLASADSGANWSTYDLATPAAANTDVTVNTSLNSLGFTPSTRAQAIKLRFAAVPQGGALTVQVDLAHVDVN